MAMGTVRSGVIFLHIAGILHLLTTVYSCENGGTALGDQCKCSEHYHGESCEIASPCLETPCSNGGDCHYSLQNCNTTDTTVNQCLYNETGIETCIGDECYATAVAFVCDCPGAYTGFTCEMATEPCALTVCQNGGTPVSALRSCDTTLGAACFNVSNNGIDSCFEGNCSTSFYDCWCDCVVEYTGKSCEIIDTCSSGPCENSGTCVITNDTYVCECLSGYDGQNCTLEINECESGPCQHGGLCADSLDFYTCTCQEGYSGEVCETVLPLLLVNECDSSPCHNGATCNDRYGHYTCSCATGYSGTTCEVGGGHGGLSEEAYIAMIVFCCIVVGFLVIPAVFSLRRKCKTSGYSVHLRSHGRHHDNLDGGSGIGLRVASFSAIKEQDEQHSELPLHVQPQLHPPYVQTTVVEPTVVELTVVEPTIVEPTVVEPTIVEPTVVEANVVEPTLETPPPVSSVAGAHLADHIPAHPVPELTMLASEASLQLGHPAGGLPHPGNVHPPQEVMGSAPELAPADEQGPPTSDEDSDTDLEAEGQQAARGRRGAFKSTRQSPRQTDRQSERGQHERRPRRPSAASGVHPGSQGSPGPAVDSAVTEPAESIQPASPRNPGSRRRSPRLSKQ